MITAEQTVICRYTSNSDLASDIEIQMTVEMETSAAMYGSVEIDPRFDPIFPEGLEDEFYRRLRNGIHEGIGLANVPLMPNSVIVRIVELRVSPEPQKLLNAEDKINLGYLIEETISGMVVTLRRSLENLQTGKETSFNWTEPR